MEELPPPLAPHWGGAVEAAVKLSKTALDHLVQNRDLDDYELITALAMAEDLINRRPLLADSDSTKDPPVLTPAMLLGRGSSLLPAFDWTDPQPKLRDTWVRIDMNARHMWDRLIREVIPSLVTRSKWRQQKPNLAVGDHVLVLDLPSATRFKWPLGLIVEATPGRDGLVRRVVVKVGGKSYERAISSLAPLF